MLVERKKNEFASMVVTEKEGMTGESWWLHFCPIVRQYCSLSLDLVALLDFEQIKIIKIFIDLTIK